MVFVAALLGWPRCHFRFFLRSFVVIYIEQSILAKFSTFCHLNEAEKGLIITIKAHLQAPMEQHRTHHKIDVLGTEPQRLFNGCLFIVNHGVYMAKTKRRITAQSSRGTVCDDNDVAICTFFRECDTFATKYQQNPMTASDIPHALFMVSRMFCMRVNEPFTWKLFASQKCAFHFSGSRINCMDI